ncbi:MAG: hypothetical protein M3T96_09760 [Acidobacteriota bacterium]|nr:hypothetical protein [Acidobacteriota bacterium]
MNKLEVSFNSPQCGWMSVGFADGAGEFHTTTAHAPHEKALPELLRILTDLLAEDSANQEYILHWNRNPEEFDFRFVKNNATLTLEIHQFPSEERAAQDQELVYRHIGTVADVCAAFAETFKQLYEDRHTDEFEFNWRQPFPLQEFEEFSRRLEK